MSVMDKVKSMLHGHETQAKQGVEKAGDAIDAKTGNRYSSRTDTAQQAADKRIDSQGGSGTNTPGTPGA